MTTSMISPPSTFPQRRSVSVRMRKISLANSMSPTSRKIGPSMNFSPPFSMKPERFTHLLTYVLPFFRKPSAW